MKPKTSHREIPAREKRVTNLPRVFLQLVFAGPDLHGGLPILHNGAAQTLQQTLHDWGD